MFWSFWSQTAETDIQAPLPQLVMYNIYHLFKQECAHTSAVRKENGQGVSHLLESI